MRPLEEDPRALRLTFVIPTRNHARFIRQCIDSCLAQAIPDSEIVVMDGGSTDGTQAILAEYGDRIRWRSQPDRGQSDALNQGVATAKGDLIAWINSDDYYTTSDSLRRLVELFDTDARLDIAYGDGERVDLEGRRIGLYRAAPYTSEAGLLANPLTFVLQPCLVFRRALFLEVGGLREDLHFAMDYELWLRMFPAARATRHVDLIVASARYHADAKSVASLGRQISEVCAIKLRGAQHARLDAASWARVLASMGILWAYWLAVRSGLRSASS
jgi:glycosyltransferase involved in cell wall biosynthesis